MAEECVQRRLDAILTDDVFNCIPIIALTANTMKGDREKFS